LGIALETGEGLGLSFSYPLCLQQPKCLKGIITNIMSQTHDVHTRLAKLSDAQRECLRLVDRHMTSKEIAIRMGVSHHTINQRLERACKRLGVATRKEAARLLAVYDPIIYEPLDIADVTANAPSFPDLDYQESSDAKPSNFLMCDAALPLHQAGLVGAFGFAPPFPRKRGNANALSIRQRLIWAMLIASFGIILSGSLISALETLGRLL
jgi:DNA-binding CsgD family transcriptional regulator